MAWGVRWALNITQPVLCWSVSQWASMLMEWMWVCLPRQQLYTVTSNQLCKLFSSVLAVKPPSFSVVLTQRMQHLGQRTGKCSVLLSALRTPICYHFLFLVTLWAAPHLSCLPLMKNRSLVMLVFFCIFLLSLTATHLSAYILKPSLWLFFCFHSWHIWLHSTVLANLNLLIAVISNGSIRALVLLL